MTIIMAIFPRFINHSLISSSFCQSSCFKMWALNEISSAFARHLQTQLSPECCEVSNYQRRSGNSMDQFLGDFKSMAITFKWSESSLADARHPPKPLQEPNERSIMNSIMDFPQDMLSNFYMKTMGVKLIYPGATVMNQVMMAAKVKDMRRRMMEQYKGIRGKLLTFDGNLIDCMFVDRRNESPNGSTLIVCCEGNIGYYECGSMWTPIHAGYSVLGWNHPGFGESTGEPFPEQEVNAIDVVIKYAVDCLQFSAENIMLFGWSIGGFTASWAAMTYPRVKGLILDASFDHINSIILGKFSSFTKKFWESSIKKNFNLDNSAHLNCYPGPVLVIRRTKDLVVSDFLGDRIQSNRANFIIFNLFQSRFPVLMEDQNVTSYLWLYLSAACSEHDCILRENEVNEDECLTILHQYMTTNGYTLPVMIGEDLDQDTRKKLILFLVHKHLLDYDEHHSTPLPVRYFNEPWNIFQAVSSLNRDTIVPICS